LFKNKQDSALQFIRKSSRTKVRSGITHKLRLDSYFFLKQIAQVFAQFFKKKKVQIRLRKSG